MARRLFCEYGPAAYFLSRQKGIALRKITDSLSGERFAGKTAPPLPHAVYRHKSLIRRQLGNVDMVLQENKATNLALACRHINGVLIKPGETFSFWHLVGNCTVRKGYKEGLTLSGGSAASGIGGGMCQFTNLIHWLALHSPLTITEHHHHDAYDLFPDFGRQVPFGCGTSILYNYLDYRLKNNTPYTFQLEVSTDEKYLAGALLCGSELPFAYHISEEDSHFQRRGEDIFRLNKVYLIAVDKRSGDVVERKLIRQSDAKVMYDHSFVPEGKIVRR